MLDLPKDPMMLFSVINMRLRDIYPSLDALCDDLHVDKKEIIDRLAAAAEEGKAKGVKGLPMKLGMEMAAEMIAKIKDEHLCDGVHIMAIGAEKNVPAILDLAGITI